METGDPQPGEEVVRAEEAVRAEEDARADIGILLVHGIGQSRSGDTLARFGEPLVRWIIEWVKGAGQSDVAVIDGLLGVEAEDPGVPSQARLRVTAQADDGAGIQTKEWLIAESWWARSFVTPTFGELVNWGAKVVPWTVFYHFRRRFVRATRRAREAWAERPRQAGRIIERGLKVAWESFLALLALVLGPLLVVVLAGILLLGLLPVPRLRQLVGAVQRRLALTVGDSYSLLGPHIGSAAIYGRVERELAWLRQRAKKIAVVAHSQGAAVAYRVVSRDTTGQCGLLVTFGAGIRKLAQIRILHQLPSGWVWLTALAIISFGVAALISRTALGGWQGPLLVVLVPGIWLVGGFAVGLVYGLVARFLLPRKKRAAPAPNPRAQQRRALTLGFASILASTALIAYALPGTSRFTTVWATLLVSFSWGWLMTAFKQASALAELVPVLHDAAAGRAAPAGEEGLPPAVRWIDMYAASDPVPNGPISDDTRIDDLELRHEARGIETIQGRNRNSVISDHTTYWSNPEDFIAPVVGALGTLSGLRLEEIVPLDRERLVVARHRRRWRVGWVGRARLLVLAAALAVWIWGDPAAYAESLLDTLVALGRGVPLLGPLLAPILPDSVGATTFTKILAMALGVAAALGMITLGRLAWEAKDRKALVTRSRYPGRAAFPHPALLFHLAWLSSVGGALLLVLRWTHGAWWMYALAAVGVFAVALVLQRSPLHHGGILDMWPRLLERLGRWTPDAQSAWAQELRAGQLGLIDPLARPDSVWQAGIASVWRRDNPALTEWHATSTAPTLREAAAWCRTHVDRVFAALGNGDYIPVSFLLDDGGDPAAVIAFWTRFLDQPVRSSIQRHEALLRRGHRLAQTGSFEAAAADYGAVVELPSVSSEAQAIARVHRGLALEQAGKPEEAMPDYDAVIGMDDAPAVALCQARLRRGLLRHDRGEHVLAQPDFTAVIEMPEVPDADAAQAHAARGWGAYLQGDAEAFLADTQRAVALGATEANILFNLAFALLVTERVEAAAEQYRAVLDTAPAADAIQAAAADIEEAGDKLRGAPAAEDALRALRAALDVESA